MNKPKAVLKGVGSFVPPIVSNDEFIRVFGKRAEAVAPRIPHASRYTVLDVDTGEWSISNTDMAKAASLGALDCAGLAPEELDMILFASATPDYPLPPSFTILQEKLGIDSCMGMDIRSGCSGFGNALVTAVQYIENRMASRILVVGSELNTSRLSFLYGDDVSKFPIKALFNYMLFGDGAGAIVLEASDNQDEGVFAVSMGSTKAHRPFGSCMLVGGSCHPYPEASIKKDDWPLVQEPALTEELIPEVFIEAVEGFLEINHLGLADFDHYILPVDSPRILQKIRLRFPEMDEDKIITVGAEGGSLVNAAVPLALAKAHAEGQLKKGKRVLIYAAENTRWQHAVIGLDCSF